MTTLLTILIVVFIIEKILEIGMIYHNKQIRQQIINAEKSIVGLQETLRQEREQYYKRCGEYEERIKELRTTNFKYRIRIEELESKEYNETIRQRKESNGKMET